MKPPTALDATIPCPDCPCPVNVQIPVEFRYLGRAVVEVTPDAHAMRLAIGAHMRQHQP